MPDLIQQGLWLGGIGFGLLFIFMGLITLMMIFLERLTRYSARSEAQDGPTAPQTDDRRPENEEITAAIAVAIAHLQAQDRRPDSLGAGLESGYGHWWLMGRTRQISSTVVRALRRGG